MVQNRKKDILRLLLMYLNPGEEVFEVVPSDEQMTYLGEEFAWGTGGWEETIRYFRTYIYSNIYNRSSLRK